MTPAPARCPRCGGVIPCCTQPRRPALREWTAGLLPGSVGTVREARGEFPLLACLFAVVTLLTVVTSAAPPLLDRLAGNALAARVETAQRTQGLIRQSAVLHPAYGTPADAATSRLAAGLADAERQFTAAARPPLAGAVRHLSTRVEVPEASTSTAAGPGRLGLLYADDAPPPAAYSQGRPPGRSTRGPVDIAVSVRTRDALHLWLGQRIDLTPGDAPYRTEARVVGFFAAPPAGRAPLWHQEPLLEGPSTAADGWHAQAVVDASALGTLQERGAGDLTVTWQSALRLTGVTATALADPAGLSALRRAADAYGVDAADRFCPPDEGGALSTTVCDVAGHGTGTLVVANDVPPLTQEFGAERAQARTLESYAVAGLLAVGLATVVVTARLALHRGAAVQRLRRARGASAADLALVRLLQSAPAVLAALPAGFVAARLLAPAGTSPGSPLPAAVLALVAWLTLPALTWAALRDRGRRREQAPAGARRLTAEAAVLGLTVAGILALRARGSDGAASGTDLQLAAVPALLGLATVVLLIRVYPLPVRLLARAARRRRGALGLIGLSRAAREAPGQALALLVLVTTLSTAVFGGLVSRTVADGRRAAAVWTAGADAAVIGAGTGGAADPALTAVPGVRRAVPLRAAGSRLTSGRDGSSWAQGRIVGVDAAALHAAAPGSALARALLAAPPGPGPAAAGGQLVLPALASADFGPAAVGDVYASSLHDGHVSFRVVGVVDGSVRQDPALGPLITTDAAHTAGPAGASGSAGGGTGAAPRPMLLLDAAAMDRLTARDTDFSEVLLYGRHLDAAALRVAAARLTGPGGRLVLRDEELAAARDDGLLRGVQRVYTAGTAAAVVLALLTLVLELLLTAQDRGRTASRLRTLGLGSRGVAALNAVELLPMALAAGAGGVALGLAMPGILGPALTLRRLTGGPAAPPLHTDYLLTAALGAGLALMVAAAVTAETWLGRRRGLGRVLRLGDSS